MIRKLLDIHRLAHFKSQSHPPAQASEAGPLRIVHAGGIVDSYYMAIPAAKIMEKYPSFVLARPEVFRRPWDSLVRPDEILTLGSKFYVVPLHTVKKLRRRIRRPTGDMGIRSCLSTEASGSRNRSVGKKHVKFADLEVKKNKGKKEGNGRHSEKGFKQKETRSVVLWQPSLTSINEYH